MMKAVGIVGYKKSGKTSLALNLCREIINRGHSVVMVKHSDSGLLPGDVDSTKMVDCAGQGAAISDSETVLSFNKGIVLEQVLSHFKADYAIIEGFKDERTYPKIVCLRDENEAKNLFDGLQIAVVGSGEDLSVPLVNDIGEITDLVLKKAFKLPNLDCGGCEYDTCYELAQAIVSGDRSVDECVSLHPKAMVRIEGETVPLNPFTSTLVSQTIQGMLSSLKGVREGTIEIKISQ